MHQEEEVVIIHFENREFIRLQFLNVERHFI